MVLRLSESEGAQVFQYKHLVSLECFLDSYCENFVHEVSYPSSNSCQKKIVRRTLWEGCTDQPRLIRHRRRRETLLSDTGTHEPWAMKTWGLPKEDKDQLQWAFREVLMPSSKTVSEICSCLMPRIPQHDPLCSLPLALDLFLLPPLRCSVHSIIFEDIGT